MYEYYVGNNNSLTLCVYRLDNVMLNMVLLYFRLLLAVSSNMRLNVWRSQGCMTISVTL